MVKMRGLLHALFAFKIFSLPVPTRPGTRTFWQVPDPSRPEVKNPYPSDPVDNIVVQKSTLGGEYCSMARKHKKDRLSFIYFIGYKPTQVCFEWF